MIPLADNRPQGAATPGDPLAALTLPSWRGFINERLLVAAARDDALFVHPHAQRTGGKTLRDRVLAAVFGAERVYGRATVAVVKRWPRLEDRDLVGYCAVSDHFDFRPGRLSRLCLPIALLRDPLYRAASLHGFVRKHAGHRLHALAQDHDLEEFYRRGRAVLPRYFRNLQCRVICGVDDARIALDMIETRYLGVGFTERLGVFANQLGGALGWPELDVRTMPPDAERYGSAITPAFQTMVVEDNAEDLVLFDAMANGPPYRIAPGTVAQRARTAFKKTENAARTIAGRYF